MSCFNSEFLSGFVRLSIWHLKALFSDLTLGLMSSLMKRQELKYRPHGFRSSLRDWAAEKQMYQERSPRHVELTL